MKEFKIATSNAKRMHDLEKEINRLAKEGFEVCSPISSVFHPFERKETKYSWVECDAWTELMVVMSREIIEQKKETPVQGVFPECFPPDMIVVDVGSGFKGEF